MESVPRVLPHLPIQRLVEWLLCDPVCAAHANVVHEREQPLRIQQILTHVHEERDVGRKRMKRA